MLILSALWASLLLICLESAATANIQIIGTSNRNNCVSTNRNIFRAVFSFQNNEKHSNQNYSNHKFSPFRAINKDIFSEINNKITVIQN